MKKLIFLYLFFCVSYLGNAQVIAIQSFETSGDTWTPVTLSTPACSNGADIWDFSTNLNGITPSHLAQFWGIQDLNGNCGGTGFETISLPDIDVSACTSMNFSFDYNAFEFDLGDDIKYELFYDNISQGEVTVVNGNGNLSTTGWETETIAIPNTVTNVRVIISVKQNGGGDWGGIDNIKLEGTGCIACPGLDTEPTNEATGESVSNITCTAADLTWTNGADATNSLVVISTSAITGTPTDGVAYSDNAVFGSGSTISAGEFVIYNGAGNSVSISGLAEGITYFITIFEYNGATANCEENYLTGGVTTSFTTLTGCVSTDPYISSINYNACSASEGTDEIVTFITGSDPIDIDDITIEYPSGGDFCNSGCGTQTNVNNPAYVNDLNVMAGCTVFTYANPIPPNATVMVFTGNPPSTVLDYSSQCGAANLPIYVIFNNNNSISGRFANSAVRDLTINWGTGSSQTVTYDGSQQGGDGATAQFDAAGNPTYFQSTDCVYPLPIELIYFNSTTANSITTLNWATASERNNDYFTIEKSTDGISFFAIGKVNGNGNSSQQIRYSFEDNSQTTATTYYRLKQYDFNGEFQYSFSIKVINTNSTIYYANTNIHLGGINGNKDYTVNIYSVNGQLLYSKIGNENDIINWTKKGLFIIEIPELQMRQKLFCY